MLGLADAGGHPGSSNRLGGPERGCSGVAPASRAAPASAPATGAAARCSKLLPRRAGASCARPPHASRPIVHSRQANRRPLPSSAAPRPPCPSIVRCDLPPAVAASGANIAVYRSRGLAKRQSLPLLFRRPTREDSLARRRTIGDTWPHVRGAAAEVTRFSASRVGGHRVPKPQRPASGCRAERCPRGKASVHKRGVRDPAFGSCTSRCGSGAPLPPRPRRPARPRDRFRAVQ